MPALMRTSGDSMVTPAKPVFQDQNGWKHDRVIIPAVEGVEYLLDGKVVAAGSHPVAKGARVAVEARLTEQREQVQFLGRNLFFGDARILEQTCRLEIRQCHRDGGGFAHGD